jgi:hypothetical protein
MEGRCLASDYTLRGYGMLRIDDDESLTLRNTLNYAGVVAANLLE